MPRITSYSLCLSAFLLTPHFLTPSRITLLAELHPKGWHTGSKPRLPKLTGSELSVQREIRLAQQPRHSELLCWMSTWWQQNCWSPGQADQPSLSLLIGQDKEHVLWKQGWGNNGTEHSISSSSPKKTSSLYQDKLQCVIFAFSLKNYSTPTSLSPSFKDISIFQS